MRFAVLMLALLLAGPAWGQAKKSKASSKKQTELVFQLAVPNEVTLKSALVEMTRGGRILYVALSDDGSVSGDQPHDGVWMGRYSGAFVQTMSLRLFVGTKKGSVASAYDGVVRMIDTRLDGMSWRLEKGRSGWIASPTTAAYPGRHGTVSLPMSANSSSAIGLSLASVYRMAAAGSSSIDPKFPWPSTSG